MDPVRIFAILIAVVVVSASAEGDTWSSSPLGKMGQGSKKERVCGIDVIDLTKEGKWKIPQSCTRLSNAAQALLEEMHSAKHNRVCAFADIDRNKSKWVIPPDCKELHLDESSIGDGAAVSLAEALIYTSAEALYLADNAIGDAGAVSIAGALKANVILRNVDLSGNSIGDIGAASIAEARDPDHFPLDFPRFRLALHVRSSSSVARERWPIAPPPLQGVAASCHRPHSVIGGVTTCKH